MKILDRYILTTYLKTFISVFVILMLIFVLQAIWLYIKELAGKDLDILTIIKFLLYITPTLIPLILPLTILLSSIMVFGNFAENYEFAAMKSTGISLQRAMSGLGIFIVFLSITTFFFSNNVIPWAEYESYNLRKNIAKVKPAMAIAEGQFNQLGDNFNIKVDKKSGDRGQFLDSVTIHQSQKGRTGNNRTTVANSGELVSNEKSDVLKLILYDGYYYDDTPGKTRKTKDRKPFLKSSFSTYTMNIDLSQLNAVDMSDKSYDSKYTMLNINELNHTVDSLIVKQHQSFKDFSKTLYTRTNIETLNLTVKTKKDTVYTGEILDLFGTKRRVQLLDYAFTASATTMQIIKAKEYTIKNGNILLNRHIISLHEKFALAIACIILFFVGAPLGALIRKGGLGLPMVIAIVLFLSYHFIGIFAKNSAKDGTINPIIATWFATLIMLPLSIFLTRRATADRGLFEFDHITVPIKKWYNKRFGRKIIITSENVLDSVEKANSLKSSKNWNPEYRNYFIIENISASEFESELSNDLLVKHNIKGIEIFRQQNTSSNYIFQIDSPLDIDNHIGFINDLRNLIPSHSNLKTSLEVDNSPLKKDFNHYIYWIAENEASIDLVNEHASLQPKLKEYKLLSNSALIAFVLAIVLVILHFVFANNKLPLYAEATPKLAAVVFIVYLFYLFKTQLQCMLINTVKPILKTPILILVIGVILYPILHLFRHKKIKSYFT